MNTKTKGAPAKYRLVFMRTEFFLRIHVDFSRSLAPGHQINRHLPETVMQTIFEVESNEKWSLWSTRRLFFIQKKWLRGSFPRRTETKIHLMKLRKPVLKNIFLGNEYNCCNYRSEPQLCYTVISPNSRCLFSLSNCLTRCFGQSFFINIWLVWLRGSFVAVTLRWTEGNFN